VIKLVYCVTRKHGVSAAAFYSYWLERHGPKMIERQAALQAVKYSQSHTVEPELNHLLQQSRGLEEPYDGITEIWWDSADVVRAAMQSPEGLKATQELLDDESTFIDFARSRLFFTEEHSVY